MPFLLISFSADVDTFKVTHLSSSGIKKRFLTKLALNLRLVLFIAWETLFPTIALFPVSSQTLDIALYFSRYFKTGCKLTIFLPNRQLIEKKYFEEK